MSEQFKVLTVQECAELLRVKPSTIYELTRYRHMARGLSPFPVRRVGRYLRFIESEVIAWLLNQPTAVKRSKRAYRRRAGRA
jgi:excisionase family DNA binding protein